MNERGVRTPKLQRDRRTDWYRYYAGYSGAFVEDIVDVLGEIQPRRILDPWNGAGTTTAVARRRGIDSAGYDINPVLVLVARSRVVSDDIAGSINAIADDLIAHAEVPPSVGQDDPVFNWFTDDAALKVRSLEYAIRSILISKTADLRNVVADASPLACLYYVALFKAVRKLHAGRMGTNPTWTKVPPKEARLEATPSEVVSEFRRECSGFRTLVRPNPEGRVGVADIRVGSSTALEAPDASFGAAVTSPPYLTRIDYAVATRLELAVIGIGEPAIRSLRNAMIGTPTVVSAEIESSDAWGATATALVESVSSHPSRASATYYRKYFLQYLSGMLASLAELRRVVAPGGRAVLVVQDSYYKEVHVDLAQILVEMGETLGFTKSSRLDFELPVTKAAINRGTRAWRSSFSARESVVELLGE